MLGLNAFGQPGALEHVLEWVVRPGNGQDDPSVFKLALKFAERFDSGHVDVYDGLCIDQKPLDRGSAASINSCTSSKK